MMLSRFRRTLATPSARWFFAAHAQSCVGTGAALVALPLLVYGRTHSAWAVTLVLICDYVPCIVLGTLAAGMASRYGRRSCAIGGDLLRVAGFLLLWRARSLEPLAAGALLAGVGSAFWTPSALAALPVIVGAGAERAPAVALFGLLDDGGLVIGPALAALLFTLISPAGVIALNAGTFLVSVALLAGVPMDAADEQQPLQDEDRRSRLWRTGWQGARRLLALRPVVAVVASSSIAVVCMGVLNVGEVILARAALHVSGSAFSGLVAAGAAGMVAGSLLGARWSTAWRWRQAYIAGAVLLVAEFVLCGAAPQVALTPAAYSVALAGFLLGGVGNALMVVHGRLLLIDRLSTSSHTDAFALYKSATSAAFVLSFLGAGALITGQGVSAAFFTAAAVMGGATIVSGRWVARLWPRPGASPDGGDGALTRDLVVTGDRLSRLPIGDGAAT